MRTNCSCRKREKRLVSENCSANFLDKILKAIVTIMIIQTAWDLRRKTRWRMTSTLVT